MPSQVLSVASQPLPSCTNTQHSTAQGLYPYWLVQHRSSYAFKQNETIRQTGVYITHMMQCYITAPYEQLLDTTRCKILVTANVVIDEDE